jgi:surface polysaccharide O-acyltransferase-like enzyme
MMPLMFTIAGISSYYALQERSSFIYMKERVCKLLIPLLFSIPTILPILSYIAGVNANKPNYFAYFTKFTDFTGYDGAFTPGHLWFIIYLFGIAMVTLPIILLYKKNKKNTNSDISLFLLLLMGGLPCIGKLIFDISGKSPTEYLVYFLLGSFVLNQDTVLKKLRKYSLLLLGIFVVSAGLTQYFGRTLYEAVGWISVLAFLGMAQSYLNFSGKIARYLANASFGIYIFHLPWVILLSYSVFKLTDQAWLQIPIILFGSTVLTFFTYEMARRIWILRFMFGLKK